MTANAVFDAAIVNQINVERLKAEEVNQFAAFLKRIDKSIRKRLMDGPELTEFSRTRLERLLTSVDRSLTSVFNEYYDDLAGHLIELAEWQAEQEAASLTNIIADELEVETVIPAPNQVRAAIFSAPLSVRGAHGGSLLDDFIQGWTHTERKRLTGAVRQGYFEGQTNRQIITTIRGTKANQYRDGLLQVTQRNAEAIVRTSVQHVASTARFETWDANADIVTGYRWVSTLDGRTSPICRHLDGEVFDLGKGPRPPVHIRCRSTTAPDLIAPLNALSKGETRASKDGPVSAKLTYYEWLKKQSAQFQDEVLGKTKGKLFRDGGMNPEKFAKLNMGKNFKPVTLRDLRVKYPKSFERAGIADIVTVKPIRTPWKDRFPDAVVDQPLGRATGHELYRLAKSGDTVSAHKLAKELISNDAIAELKAQIGDEKPVIVPVHAEEAAGRNKIPIGVATVLAKRLGLTVDDEIVQAANVSRTGKDGWHRIANSPSFAGRFPKGAKAIIVDDTLTQGGTLASLKGHIERQGGEVLSVYTLTGKQYSRQLRLSTGTLSTLRDKHGSLEKWWQKEFGYGFDGLTESEARYIINSGKAADEIRDLITKAR